MMATPKATPATARPVPRLHRPPVGDYFSSLETNNINQRVRSGRLVEQTTMTHGCYWKKCSF